MKRFFFLTLFFIALQTIAYAQSRIVVQINGLKNKKGVCRACLFTDAASFSGKSGKPFMCTQAALNKEAQLVFEGVPSGTYAVSVFHDENNNNKMDLNFFGIPKEGYGASKNKLPFTSAPAFDDNKFSVSGTTPVNLNIKLRNL